MAILYSLSFLIRFFIPKESNKINVATAALGGVLFIFYIYCLAKNITLLNIIDGHAMIFEMITYAVVVIHKFILKKEDEIEKLILLLSLAVYKMPAVPLLLLFIVLIDAFKKLMKSDFGETSRYVFTLSLIFIFTILHFENALSNTELLLFPLSVFFLSLFKKEKTYTGISFLIMTTVSVRYTEGLVNILLLGFYILAFYLVIYYQDAIKKWIFTISNNSFIEKSMVKTNLYFNFVEEKFKLEEVSNAKKEISENYEENSFKHDNTIRSSMILILITLALVSLTYTLHLKNLL